MKKIGITLIELLIYIGLSAIILSALVYVTFNLLGDNVRADVMARLNDETSLVKERITYYVNRADSLDAGSIYAINPSTLIVNDGGILNRFEIYTKTVTINGNAIDIKKLRFKSGSGDYVDLTSDTVTVDRFIVTDMSNSSIGSVRVDWQVRSRNAAGGKYYNSLYANTFSATIKK